MSPLHGIHGTEDQREKEGRQACASERKFDRRLEVHVRVDFMGIVHGPRRAGLTMLCCTAVPVINVAIARWRQTRPSST